LGHGEYYRLLTSGFVHADWPHVIFNLFSLYSFGNSIARLFGPVTFALIYFSGIIGGNLLALLLHRYETYRALGASGGVCGIIFASIFLLPGGSISLFLLPVEIPAYVYAVLFILASVYGIHGRIGNIGHEAHLGGAIVGLAVATALHPYIFRLSPGLYALVMGLSTALLVGLYWRTRAVNPLPRFYRRSTVSRKVREQQADDKIMDDLLEKISKFGMNHLTEAERKQLDVLGRKRKFRDR
jgi:membrane associated rhomboid family serine protease